MAAGALAPGEAGAQVSAEQTLAIGRDVLDMNDYVLAIQYFNQSIGAKPYLSEPYFYRGLAKMMLEDYEGAVADCSQAIRINPFKTDPYRVRGASYLQLGRDSLALADFTAGLQHSPRDRNFLYYKGIAASRLGRYAEADSTFRLVEKYYPKYADPYVVHARSAALAGQPQVAMQVLDAGIGRAPHSPALRASRARLYAGQGRWLAALADLDEAIRTTPRDAALYADRGVVRARMGEMAAARSDLKTALEFNPKLGVAAENLRKLDAKSLDALAFSTEADPALAPTKTATDTTREIEPISLFAFTFTHPYYGMRPTSNLYDELEDMNRSHWFPSDLYLSPYAGDTPDPEQAVALFSYSEGFEAEGAPAMGLPQYLGRAVAYGMLKNYEAALTDLNRAVAMRPDFVAPLLQRAWLRMAMHEGEVKSRRITDKQLLEAKAHEAFTLALADLDAALALEQDNPYIWYNKGVLELRASRPEDAAASFSRALDLDPSFAEARFNRGIAYMRLNRPAQARADLSRAGELGLPDAYSLLKRLQ